MYLVLIYDIIDLIQPTEYYQSYRFADLCHSIPNLDSTLDELKQNTREMYRKVSGRTIFGGIDMFHIKKALELYDSPDYHSEVERIVKKYCKDCK
ncbi:hypothetical protein LS70_009235 [Helicobacter sp. MIT 11-5569]|uniref:hypothetical protein n=1 Tax=Helicobacter sp. MIT 11-5569 TaxID=1548151 RepID=UPI00051FD74F|nr:hypothetical protein [Helicobacter sp. MIT 11-5569]TLD80353.1 hypothetical protein LS70_009235 [Helicobacter sp. MIT 11-5569]